MVLLYEHVTFGDLGLAIIALTLVIRFVLYPVFYKGIKGQMVMQRMQPHLKKIQVELKHDKTKQAEAMMALYKEHQINPLSPLFYSFIQLPLLFAVYRIFFTGITTESLKDLYSFIPAPETLNPLFLGTIDMTKPNMIIVAIAVIASFIQSHMLVKQTMAKNEGSASNPMTKYMAYMAPLLSLLFLPRFPSAIGLYWTVSSVFSIFQQRAITKQLEKLEKKAISK
jgi:YidC/Oxa1 family membrane protein insertase